MIKNLCNLCSHIFRNASGNQIFTSFMSHFVGGQKHCREFAILFLFLQTAIAVKVHFPKPPPLGSVACVGTHLAFLAVPPHIWMSSLPSASLNNSCGLLAAHGCALGSALVLKHIHRVTQASPYSSLFFILYQTRHSRTHAHTHTHTRCVQLRRISSL